ncbi:TasA family protein [Nocardioides sp. Root140]|uniref:TasA family protein n=1 Tax=Nocardioides sp. Root140 TaxID=1736460 RepID=UPI0006F279A5|nr:TasA family protein [Nocardioides sp. Root140]KQY64714.1 hypothetical protein ASD30_07410 [Nocardioides sp. Root140]
MRSISKPGRKHSVKILASAGLVIAAAGVAGLGTYGSFTSTTSASTNVGTGTVKLDLANQATRGLDIAVTSMVPADYAQRAVQLTRSATSESFGSVTLKTSLTTDNLLKTGSDGLKLQIDACSAPWVKAAGSNDLTCSGTTTVVLASGAATQTDVALPKALADLDSATRVANLRIQLSLPQTANNDYQGLSNAVNVDFTATQRAGQAQ